MHPTTPKQQSQRNILSVSQLNRQAKRLLENQFPSAWIEGEISNLARPSSGHWYFSLKDANAQVRCAMFRNSNQRLRFQPQAGQKVVVRAKLSLYEARGDYQLIAEYMEPAGAGDLARAFEELKARLSQEGLFDEAFKQPIPDIPTHIAVITSPTGAAIRDILTVLKRRFPSIPVSILPVAVQGNQAAPQIAHAIRLANRMVDEGKSNIDVIITGRGGGSLEDLWAFNEEIVARAISDSDIPIVSAVGHEVDFTIADFVADVRAATPSAAAELLSPDQDEILQTLYGYQQWLTSHVKRQLQQHEKQLHWLRTRLRHPGSRLTEHQQRLDELDIRLQQAWGKSLKHHQHRAELMLSRLKNCHPGQQLASMRQQAAYAFKQLKQQVKQQLELQQQQLQHSMQRLNTVSPLATLERGYAMITTNDGALVTDSKQLKTGDTLHTKLAKGSVKSTVESTST